MCVAGAEEGNETNMQNNQSMQSIPSLAWQRKAARTTTSNCTREHRCTLLHSILSGKSRCSSQVPPRMLPPPLQAYDLPCPSPSVQLLCPPTPSYLDMVIPTSSCTPSQLPNDASPPHLACLRDLKPGGNPLLGEVMVGGSAGLSEQHTQEDGRLLICRQVLPLPPPHSTG